MDFFHAVRGKASSFFLKKKYSRKNHIQPVRLADQRWLAGAVATVPL